MGSKILLIGIDAMDPGLFNRLRDQLPNFNRLIFSSLESTIPPETPVAWSAIATGCNPGKYGIYDFLTRDPETYRPRLNLAIEKPGLLKTSYQSAMLGTPVWRILSDKNVSATVIRWPVTFPPEKIKGRILSGLGVVDLRGMLNSYVFFSNDPADLKGEGARNVIPIDAQNGHIATDLPGPITRKKGQIVSATVPLNVYFEPGKARIEIGKEAFTLGLSRWSDLTPVTFKPLSFVEVHGLVSFHLVSTEPYLRLYASSVQFDPAQPFMPIASPKDYSAELAESIGKFYTLGMPEETKAVTDGYLGKEALRQQIVVIEKQRRAMLFYELDRFTDGFLAVIFDAGDRLNHIFWETGLKTSGEVPTPIAEYYKEKDTLLGEVLDRIDSETRLLVLSDHGFHDFTRQVNINRWLCDNQYLAVKEQKGDLFEYVDWNQTQAYSVGFTSIFLNLRGREAKGKVSQAEKDTLLDRLKTGLRELRDDDGTPAVTDVYRADRVYTGEHVGLAPDLVIGFSPGYRMSWRSAIGGLEDEIIAENRGEWKGDHLIDRSHVPGVLFTNFGRRVDGCSVLDIAPTVLRLLNQEIPQGIDGSSLID